MPVRGIRGATTAAGNTREAVLDAAPPVPVPLDQSAVIDQQLVADGEGVIVGVGVSVGPGVGVLTLTMAFSPMTMSTS